MTEKDYNALLVMSDPPNPNQQKIIKQVIDWFFGPDAQGKPSKDWSKRLLRPRPRLEPLATTTEYATQYDTSIPLLPSSARIPYPFIILGGVLILGVLYLLLFLIIDRLRCCNKETARRKNRTTERPARRQTLDGLYSVEDDSLGSGNVPPSSKVSDDAPPPSYEDAILASQQQTTPAK
ncbi:uncharacterized protein LOC130690339 isoform X1 [Daphnia carinata]|uniref:uncharacterized protein LOC130690339 isoform X1 n=1 Tax=Daphnia carinata TaxID=120202 RepID=UPI00257A2831|nr:uncharacterized protein LOC130690339 isoform X1 [Daphnia carinata]XP_059351783.1 uncharacterized protein LOC130690339 isoform X1 [Daphnia carinata]